MVKRMTRPFGTFAFSVNAGSGTYGGAMRELPSTPSRTGTSGGALAGRCACAAVPIEAAITRTTARLVMICWRSAYTQQQFDDQLIEALVGEAARRERLPIERFGLELRSGVT